MSKEEQLKHYLIMTKQRGSIEHTENYEVVFCKDSDEANRYAFKLANKLYGSLEEIKKENLTDESFEYEVIKEVDIHFNLDTYVGSDEYYNDKQF